MKVVTTLLLVALGLAVVPSIGQAGPVKVGESAPNFVATDSQGDKTSLTDLKGKPVVLAFSRAHW